VRGSQFFFYLLRCSTFHAEVHAKLLPLTSASYNSKDARPGCLENTRVALQQHLSDWANDDAPKLTTLWLNGMAGTGKSAISTTFALNMADEGLLGATFFVDRQVAERTDIHRIVQSLAYDLAEGDHNRLSALWSALCAKPTIKDMPLREQVQALIRRPLDSTYSETLVIVIDGLDECVPSEGALLLSTLVECLAGFPIKLLVSSRNDQDIARGFVAILHTAILLQEQPLEEVKNDVCLYWEHSLDKLCPPGDDTDWRHAVSLDRLAELTGHLFIYATTILKMIQNVKHSRIEELTNLVGKANPSPEAGKRSLLNDLYFRILSQAISNHDDTVNPKSVRRMREILEVVIFARHPLTRCALSQLLAMKMDELDGHLATLVSVLIVPDTTSADDVVRPLHQSFPDFVVQHAARVHCDLIIDAATANAHFTEHCLARLNKELHMDMCDVRDPSLFNDEVKGLKGLLQYHIPLALRYSCRFWTVHYLEYVRATGPQSEMPLGLDEFCHDHLLHWIELSSLINGLNDVMKLLPLLLTALEVSFIMPSQSYTQLMNPPSQNNIYLKGRDISTFLTDTLFLMRAYLVPIRLSALHVYYSGVVSMPLCSLNGQVLHPKVGRLLSQRDHQWSTGPILLEGHKQGVNSVAFSPDSTQIISGSDDHTIRVWDAVSGAHLHTMNGHKSRVSSVAFSPDGSQIISGSGDHTVRVWDAVSGKHMHTINGHTSRVSSVAFSPDGSQIVSGSGDHTVRVWDAVSGKRKHTLSAHTGSITSVAFSPDGSHIISGSHDCNIRIWNAISGEHKYVLAGHTDSIRSVAFSPDVSHIISGSDDRTVRVWDAISGAQMYTMSSYPSIISPISFSPDGSQTVSDSWDETVRVEDAVYDEHKHILIGHIQDVASVAFSPDGFHIVSGSSDRTVRVWDAVSGAPKHTLTGHTDWIRSVAFSPNGTQIISGSHDRTVRVWDAMMPRSPESTLVDSADSMIAGARSPSGSQATLTFHTQSVVVWTILYNQEVDQHSSLDFHRFQMLSNPSARVSAT
jgi:WD40 repeat protein